LCYLVNTFFFFCVCVCVCVCVLHIYIDSIFGVKQLHVSEWGENIVGIEWGLAHTAGLRDVTALDHCVRGPMPQLL